MMFVQLFPPITLFCLQTQKSDIGWCKELFRRNVLYYLTSLYMCSEFPASIWLSCRFINWEISNSYWLILQTMVWEHLDSQPECEFSHYLSKHLSIYYISVNDNNPENGNKKKNVKKWWKEYNLTWKITSINV